MLGAKSGDGRRASDHICRSPRRSSTVVTAQRSHRVWRGESGTLVRVASRRRPETPDRAREQPELLERWQPTGLRGPARDLDRRTDGSDIVEVKGTPRLYYGLPMGPAFSPDGSTIAFFHAETGPMGDIWTIPAAGGTPKRVTLDLREGGWPVWTPDGQSIIFSSARAGSRTLWQVRRGRGEPVALTTGAGQDDQPDISADGRRLAYTNVRNAWDLRVRNLETGRIRSCGAASRSCFLPSRQMASA